MALLNDRLALFDNQQTNKHLRAIVRGIEKESLRVSTSGHIATTAHPRTLGSALTHPSITTDYSEALLEFITAPSSSMEKVLAELEDIHRFTYRQIGDELLWASSMPCQLGPDDQIPIAEYGTSNIGIMKRVYRLGLGHRYGRAMQTIAGIHYNFSVPDELWLELQRQQQNNQSLQDFKSAGYFHLIRNFRRYAWLLLYLLGSAPAVCRSFVANRDHQLSPVGADSHSLYQPYATSLRMGDLGYQSQAQSAVEISYNSLDEYVASLRTALVQPFKAYDEIGLKDDQGNYKQLNTHLLQIENEFYSAIRPKRTANPQETPLQALQHRGVEYIEVRCLDVNPLLACGIDGKTIRFLDTFLLFCLFSESPPNTSHESTAIAENMLRTVYQGRDPQLKLQHNQSQLKLRDWGGDLLSQMQPVAEQLDTAYGGHNYAESLHSMQSALTDPSLTPSATMLREMDNNHETYYRMAMRKAQEHREFFLGHDLDRSVSDHYRHLATLSHEQQAHQENNDQLSFDTFLANYWKSSKNPQ
jgi:glutamate--cysteine ligase